MKKSRLLLFVLTMCLATLGTWAQTDPVKTWDFTQTMPTDDKTHLDAELAKTEGTKLWAQDGNNTNTWMNNTAYSDFTELTANSQTIELTQGLQFKGAKNNIRIYQQDSKKYIQMKDGVQIKIPNLKANYSIVFSAQLSNAEYTLSFDSDQMQQVSKSQSNKDVTIVSTVKETGDATLTINSKKTSDNSGQNILMYSITVLPYTDKPVKSWDFTSWNADDITYLNADAETNDNAGTNWAKPSGKTDQYQNKTAISNSELIANNGTDDRTLETTKGIKFTVVKDKLKLYNESKAKYISLDETNSSKTNTFTIALETGQVVAIKARSTHSITAAKISATNDSGITNTATADTKSGDAPFAYTFMVTENDNYTFKAENYGMYIYSIVVSQREYASDDPVTPVTYTITFDSNGGSTVDPITAEAGANITKPADPTKDGYDFAGWYQGDAKFTFPATMPEENITLTAHWTEKTPVETEKAFVILTAGQSNADGRIKDALTYDYTNCQISYCNGKNITTEGDFKTFDATCDADGKRWGFDAVVYQHVSEALNKKFYVIKETKGSTAIHPDVNASSNAPCWSADTDFLSSATSANQGGRSLLKGLISNVQASIAKLTDGYDIKCLLWHQGESDRKYGSVYYDNLKATIGYIRDQLATATGDEKYKTLPVICGTVSKYSGQYNKAVEDAINKLATEDANFHVIDMSDATFLSDGYHFDAASATYLGGEMFNKMIDLGLITADKVQTTKPTPVTDGSTTYDFKQWTVDNLTSDNKYAQLTLDETALQTLDGQTAVYKVADPHGAVDDLFLQGRLALADNTGNKVQLFQEKGLFIKSQSTTLTILDLQPGDAVYADFSAGSSVSSILSFLSNNAFLEGSSTDATAIAKGDALTTKKNYIIKTGTQLDLTFGSQETASYYIASLKITPAKMTETIAVPTISKVEEEGKATVTLTATATNLHNTPAIYYTTDGTTPTTESNLYTEPFELTEAGEYTVKAIAVSNDKSSEAATETVTVKAIVVITPPSVVLDEENSTLEKKKYTVTFAEGQTLKYWRPQDDHTESAKSTSYDAAKNGGQVTLVATQCGTLEVWTEEKINNETRASEHIVIEIDNIVKKPKTEYNRVENGATIYTITFMDGETLHYTLPGSETEQTVTTGTSVEVQVTVSGKLTAYTTRGGLTSAESTTNVYAPAPAVASGDSYDFNQLSSMASDMTLAFDGTVTVGGATLHKPNALTAGTFNNRFAFSEGTDWMLLKAGRLRAKNGNAAKQMAVLGLQAGQVISITYSNNNIALHYTAASGTATLEGLEDNAALENKKFYTVGTAGDLLLTVPADESNNCEMTKIELNVVEDVPAPVLTKREGKENVVDVTVGKSSIGNTVTTYYTTDGSTPTANSTLLEKSSITVKQTSTIRAITISSSGKASEVSNAITLTETQEAPTLSLKEGTNNVVVIASSKSSFGSSFRTYYTTNGTAPTTESTSTTGTSKEVKLNASGTVKAFTVSEGGTESAVSELTIEISDDYTMASTTTDNGGVEVTEVTNPAGSTITIPGTVAGQDVTAISDDAFNGISAEVKATVQNIDLSATKITNVEVSRESGVFKGFPETTLIFMPDGNTVASDEKNVVLNGICDDFEMQDGKSYGIGKSFTATKATLNREFTANQTCTVCLPYAVPAANIPGKIYTFASVANNQVTMTEDADGLDANVPYIFVPNEATNISCTGSIAVGIDDHNAAHDDFTFKGIYKDHTFTAEEIAKGIYGFAGAQAVGATPGHFAKAATGAYIKGMRAYLEYTGSSTDAGLEGPDAPVSSPRFGDISNPLPNSMDVILVDADGTTTHIGKLELVDSDDSPRYNLNGQRVGEYHKGIVVKNGKVVVIK